MYVGPSRAELADHNMVYPDIPQNARETIAKAPILERLFISDLRLYPIAERQIREKSGAFWDAYQAALAYEGGTK